MTEHFLQKLVRLVRFAFIRPRQCHGRHGGPGFFAIDIARHHPILFNAFEDGHLLALIIDNDLARQHLLEPIDMLARRVERFSDEHTPNGSHDIARRRLDGWQGNIGETRQSIGRVIAVAEDVLVDGVFIPRPEARAASAVAWRIMPATVTARVAGK